MTRTMVCKKEFLCSKAYLCRKEKTVGYRRENQLGGEYC